MIRCLCCNKEIKNPSEYEKNVMWHDKCIHSFFGTKTLPEIDLSDEQLKRLANLAVQRGFTVPGVQKKLSLQLDNSENKTRLTIVDYPARFILKPQSDEYNFLPEAEYMVMKMAEEAKIKTVPNAMVWMNGKYAYITKRIDRKSGQLYAMEDFCQLSGRMTEDKYRGSYENCAKVIKQYSRNYGLDLTDFYYRLLFCFITGNSDMHFKNFSLIEDLPGSRQFGLSEAYDLLPVNILVPQDTEQMALTVNGKKRNIRKKDFLLLAERLDITKKTAERLMQELLKHKPQFVSIVEQSYISEDLKTEMIQLIEQRASVLL
ncbi:MAG: HipA domain-containing protein [Faecalicoccus sp.]|nr:HipA domain-containing protein [Faecalicoccus sp.]